MFEKTISARFQLSKGGEEQTCEALNPGDWFGEVWIVEVVDGQESTYFAVEAQSCSDAIDEFADSKYGHMIKIGEPDIKDYDLETVSRAGNDGAPVCLDGLALHECNSVSSRSVKATYWLGDVGPIDPEEYASDPDLAKIKAIANYALSRFEGATRDNGEFFYRVRRHSEELPTPEWVNDLVINAHGDMMPDDWRYAMIRDVLDAIDDCEDIDEISIEPSIYTSDLCRWLGSDSMRFGGYVADVFKDQDFADISEVIQAAMSLEYDEIIGLVVEFIRNMIAD